MSIRENNWIFHGIEIYPVDSVLNNWALNAFWFHGLNAILDWLASDLDIIFFESILSLVRFTTEIKRICQFVFTVYFPQGFCAHWFMTNKAMTSCVSKTTLSKASRSVFTQSNWAVTYGVKVFQSSVKHPSLCIIYKQYFKLERVPHSVYPRFQTAG